MNHRYLIALGSNVRHTIHGLPRAVLAAAAQRMGKVGTVMAVAPVIDSLPVGPSLRRYANGALVLETALPPEPLLTALKTIEAEFGNRRGQRWGARVLDLDIVLWSGGVFRSRVLSIPHVAFRRRAFVLVPLEKIGPDWRDPRTGRTIRQLAAMLRKARRQPANGSAGN